MVCQIIIKCESQNTFNNCDNQHNSSFDVLLHEITDAPRDQPAPTAKFPKAKPMIYHFIPHVIYSLSRYVLSQLHSLLTRSCVIKYNTYIIIKTGCIWLSGAGPGRCRLSNWFVRLIILQVRESVSSRPIV